MRFGGDFILAVWQIIIGSPNLDYAIFVLTVKQEPSSCLVNASLPKSQCIQLASIPALMPTYL